MTHRIKPEAVSHQYRAGEFPPKHHYPLLWRVPTWDRLWVAYNENDIIRSRKLAKITGDYEVIEIHTPPGI